MIAIPQMDEQEITANLIEQKGLGIAFLQKDRITGASLKKAIEKILGDESYRRTAAEFSDDIKSLGGAKASADAIVNFLKK